MSNLIERATIVADAHHDGRKTKGQAEVWGVDTCWTSSKSASTPRW